MEMAGKKGGGKDEEKNNRQYVGSIVACGYNESFG